MTASAAWNRVSDGMFIYREGNISVIDYDHHRKSVCSDRKLAGESKTKKPTDSFEMNLQFTCEKIKVPVRRLGAHLNIKVFLFFFSNEFDYDHRLIKKLS